MGCRGACAWLRRAGKPGLTVDPCMLFQHNTQLTVDPRVLGCSKFFSWEPMLWQTSARLPPSSPAPAAAAGSDCRWAADSLRWTWHDVPPEGAVRHHQRGRCRRRCQRRPGAGVPHLPPRAAVARISPVAVATACTGVNCTCRKRTVPDRPGRLLLTAAPQGAILRF